MPGRKPSIIFDAAKMRRNGDTMKELPKTYDPSSFEDRLYKTWSERGYFKPSDDRNAPTYSIVIPPPNITGQLHMGHALDNTLQDVLVRYKRMKGFSTLWVPGTDHASIATEAKIVEAMRREGITKDDIGRDGFLERAWAWKRTYGGRIVEQLKKLGSSLRLVERALYDGRRMLRSGARGFRPPLRKGTHLPRKENNKLVPEMPDVDLRCRGRI